jgi:hypothetical protein
MSALQKYIVAAAVAVAGFAFSAAAQPAEAQYGWGHRPHYSRHFAPRHHHWQHHWHRPHYRSYYRPYRHYYGPPVRHYYYPHYYQPRSSWGFGFHFGW